MNYTQSVLNSLLIAVKNLEEMKEELNQQEYSIDFCWMPEMRDVFDQLYEEKEIYKRGQLYEALGTLERNVHVGHGCFIPTYLYTNYINAIMY